MKFNKQIFYYFIAFLLISNHLIAQSGRIEGRVFNSKNNEPLPFTNLIIYETNIGSTTDLDGKFSFTGVTPGFVRLAVSSVGFESYITEDFQVTNSKVYYIEIGLKEKAIELEKVVIKASPFRRDQESPVSLRTLNISEIEKSPGSNRDISKVIQGLPGVASTPAFRNDVIVRGGGPFENTFFLDGVEIPTINHFSTQGASGGPTGIINVDFVRSVDFYSGAFPANRGDALSSVIDFKLIDGNNEKMKFRATLGASETGLTLDGPVTKNSNLIFSVRRSYLQFLFSALELPFLPTYNDIQFKYKIKLDEKNQLTFIGIGALDKNVLNTSIENPDEEQAYILGYLPVNEQWSYTTGVVYRHFAKSGFDTWVLSRNYLDNRAYKYLNNIETNSKTIDYKSIEAENKLRFERTREKRGYTYNFGAGVEQANYNIDSKRQEFINGDLLLVNQDNNFKLWSWSAFGQVSKAVLSERLNLSFGIRMDANDYSKYTNNLFEQFAPRASASYALAEKWFLNANIGRYYQKPSYTTFGYTDSTGNLANKSNGLKYISADHYVSGIEFRPNENSKITVEGFYKFYQDYPMSINDSVAIASKGADFGVFGDEAVTSTAKGDAYGVELYARHTDFYGFNFILSYTYVRSKFQNSKKLYIPSSWDNKHLLNLTVLRKLSNNWDIGLKWRYVGGAPYTPYDLEKSSFVLAWETRGMPYLDYSRFNTLRTDAFHQLDLRVDKKYFFKSWSLMLYLDIQNIYNFQSVLPDNYIVATDENGKDIIINPEAPIEEQKYQLKAIPNTSGTVLPTIGIIVEF